MSALRSRTSVPHAGGHAWPATEADAVGGMRPAGSRCAGVDRRGRRRHARRPPTTTWRSWCAGPAPSCTWGCRPRARRPRARHHAGWTGVVEHTAGDLVVVVRRRHAARRPAGPTSPRPASGSLSTRRCRRHRRRAGRRRLRPGRPGCSTAPVRDLLIGVTIVRADGVVAQAGGKVVKNVAGYDLGKLLTGSSARSASSPRPRSGCIRCPRRAALGAPSPGRRRRTGMHALVQRCRAPSWSPPRVELDRPAVGAARDALPCCSRASRAASQSRAGDCARPARRRRDRSRRRPGWWGGGPVRAPARSLLKVTTRSSRVAAPAQRRWTTPATGTGAHRARARQRRPRRAVTPSDWPARSTLAPSAAVVAGLRERASGRSAALSSCSSAPADVRTASTCGARCGGLELMRRGQGPVRPRAPLSLRPFRRRDLDGSPRPHRRACLRRPPAAVARPGRRLRPLWVLPAHLPDLRRCGARRWTRPRGRIHLMKQGLAGRADDRLDGAAHRPCLGCMACVTACPSGVQYDRLIEDDPGAGGAAARAVPGRAGAARRAIFALFPYPRRLRLLRGPLRLTRPAGCSRRLRRSGVLRRISPTLATMEELAPPSRRAERVPERTPAHGCAGAARSACCSAASSASSSPVSTRPRPGCWPPRASTWSLPRPQGCCGALSAHSGREAEAQRFARALIDTFDRARGRRGRGQRGRLRVVDEGVRRPAARTTRSTPSAPQRLPASVRDVSEFLVEVGPVAPRHPLPVHDRLPRRLPPRARPAGPHPAARAAARHTRSAAAGDRRGRTCAAGRRGSTTS